MPVFVDTNVEDRFGLAFWDAPVVAAARLGTLLTEDLQHGTDLEGLWVVDPLRHRSGGAGRLAGYRMAHHPPGS